MKNNSTPQVSAGAPRPGVGSSDLLAALENLEGLAERWESTPVWHEPLFRDGRININTGDLHDIAVLFRWAQRAHAALEDIGAYKGEGGPGTPWRDIVRDCGAKAREALSANIP